MKFTELAQPWQANPTKAPRLPIKANHSFYWMHHPKNWELYIFEVANRKKGEDVEETRKIPLFIPKLTKLIEKPGVNNVVNYGSQVSSSYSQSNFIERGFEILQHNQHDYLRMYPAQGGKFYTHRFVELELIGNELLRSTNTEGYAQFRKDLVKNGHLEIPHTGIIRIIIKKMNDQITMLKKKINSPAHQEELETEENRLEYARIALETLEKKGVKAYE